MIKAFSKQTLMFILFIITATCQSLALLINTSKNFFNYRHMSNIQSFKFTLMAAGFPESQIHSICREDPFFDIRNTAQHKILLSSNVSIEHSNLSIEDLTDQYILNLLNLRHKFLYKLSENDNILIYICGHAATEFFKICDKYYMFTDDIMTALVYLSKRVKRAVIILDTCQASSLIKPSEIPPNICVITTSNADEFSYSSIYVPSLGVSTIDDFGFSIFNRGLNLDSSLKSYFNGISDEISSTVTCWGNGDFTLKSLLFDNENHPIQKFRID